MSAIPLAVLTLLLYVVIRAFGGDAINGGSQIALLSATSVCVMLSIGIYRCRWAVLEEAIIDNIRASASALLLLLLIGGINTACPQLTWHLDVGWKVKDAEPSEAALTWNRIVGVVLLVIAGIMILV